MAHQHGALFLTNVHALACEPAHSCFVVSFDIRGECLGNYGDSPVEWSKRIEQQGRDEQQGHDWYFASADGLVSSIGEIIGACSSQNVDGSANYHPLRSEVMGHLHKVWGRGRAVPVGQLSRLVMELVNQHSSRFVQDPAAHDDDGYASEPLSDEP